jgi:hypothetical protein
MNTSRRSFLVTGLAASTSLAFAGTRLAGADAPAAAPAELPKRPPPLDHELVGKMVRAAHTDLPQVTALLAETPTLANATWDWGGGDWETPLEAAAHMGRSDIARYLLAHGARPSLFAAAMLGESATVIAAVNAQPVIANTRGPHGISLLYHVAIGGDVAMAEAIKPHLRTPDQDCNRALQAAARDGQADIAAWLLRNGVTDPNLRDFADNTPLKVAMTRGHTDVAAVLRKHGATE